MSLPGTGLLPSNNLSPGSLPSPATLSNKCFHCSHSFLHADHRPLTHTYTATYTLHGLWKWDSAILRSLPPRWKDCTTATPQFIQQFHRQALAVFPFFPGVCCFSATTEMSWQKPSTVYLNAFAVFKAGYQGWDWCWDAFRRAAPIHTATTALPFQGRFYKISNGCPREWIELTHEKIHNNEWGSILGSKEVEGVCVAHHTHPSLFARHTSLSKNIKFSF